MRAEPQGARVVEFDEHGGIGRVETHAGTSYRFHCTAIIDGTRTIPVGTAVEVVVANGPIGTVEAVTVRRSAGA